MKDIHSVLDRTRDEITHDGCAPQTLLLPTPSNIYIYEANGYTGSVYLGKK